MKWFAKIWKRDASACKLCVEQTGNPVVMKVSDLFSSYKERARIAKCKSCDQLYLEYFVDYREDIFEYTCQISEQERETIATSTVQHQLILELLQGKRVFYRTPWSSESL